jgi:hypothetical protein
VKAEHVRLTQRSERTRASGRARAARATPTSDPLLEDGAGE